MAHVPRLPSQLSAVRRCVSCILSLDRTRPSRFQRLMAPCIGLLAGLLVAACEQGGGPPPEYRPGEAGTVDHALCLLGFSAVPVRGVDPGHHLIEATINGQTGNFVLDTGANVTVINASQAERFGLAAGGGGGRFSGLGMPAGASGNASQVSIESFEIGSITVRQNRIVIADLGHLLDALGRTSGREVAGIVGQDVLNEHRAIIDVARPMLYLMEENRDPAPVAAERCRSADGEGATSVPVQRSASAVSANLPEET